MKIKNKAVAAYSLIILFFAAVYYLTWSVYPDSFIKNSSLNSTPVHNAINLAFSYDDIAHENYDKISIENFSDEVLKAKNEFDGIVSQNINLERILSQQESVLTILNESLTKAWAKNTQAYVDEASLKNRKELVVKESERKAILSQKSKTHESQFDIILADKNVEISEVKLRVATAERNALEYVLSHVGDFNDPKIVFEINVVTKEIDGTRSNLIKNKEGIVKIKNHVQDLLNKRQKEDLNFWDFTFYSIGISTTTTFGDLVANSRIIRAFVCIQLLLSILVLANVTQSFLSKNKNL